SKGGEVWLWKVEGGELVSKFDARDAQEVIFNPRGSSINVFNSNQMIEFDIVNGKKLMSIALVDGELNEGTYVSDPLDALIVNDDQSLIGSQKTGAVWPMLWSTQAYLDRIKEILPRCLTPRERKNYYLDPEPPAWCIEMAKWPYHTEDWKRWLDDKKTDN